VNAITKIPQVVLNATGNNAIVIGVDRTARCRHLHHHSRGASAAVATRWRRGGTGWNKGGEHGYANGSYYVVIRHRNHLAVMTASTMALSGTSTSINFKLSATATYGTGARQDVAGTQVPVVWQYRVGQFPQVYRRQQ